MTISMYDMSVPLMRQNLIGLSWILQKGADHAAARGLDPAVILATRLYPNMYPLSRQVVTATYVVGRTALLVGEAPPTFPGDESSFNSLQQEIAAASAFLKAFTRERLEGSEERALSITLGDGLARSFTGLSYLGGYILPNFYFHCALAHGILRHCGVEIGKADFVGWNAPAEMAERM